MKFGEIANVIRIILLLLIPASMSGQIVPDSKNIIEEIGSLENVRDPKCHATASRLEDFMYGTALDAEARNARIEFQQRFIRHIWQEYSRGMKGKAGQNPQLFKQIESQLLTYKKETDHFKLFFANEKILEIDQEDLRQYGSVAYSLRAILAVQQSFLFEEEDLLPLTKEGITYFKNSIDLAVLSVLKIADQHAREENAYRISKLHIDQAIDFLFPSLSEYSKTVGDPKAAAKEQSQILGFIIDKKLNAYDQYNKVNQSVFLRNVQVYFSRITWPSDQKLSDDIKTYYTEVMVQFSQDLLLMAQTMAFQNRRSKIAYMDAYQAVQQYLPHELNNFEDVLFFPKLSRAEQITIEAYDFDAFRDSGWHWKYLRAALGEDNMRLDLAPDPFALEMIVEGIAQFAVLLFRVGGHEALEKGQSMLLKQNLVDAISVLQNKITRNSQAKNHPTKVNSIYSSTSSENSSGQIFTEVTNEIGLNFTHRSSDWLSRLMRGYVIKKDEQLARISIPPAFSGSGIAAEDLNHDGWIDILLLSGLGNKIYLNQAGKKFVDKTEKTGIDWSLKDGTKAEPRQPIIADFDNDGHQDIFISYVNENHRIYKNNGDAEFEDMTSMAQLGGAGLVGGPATAFDFNRDGLLDIYIGYFGNYIEGELPTIKRSNANGLPNKLFMNLGDFKFKDVSSSSGVDNIGWTQAVGHCDINGDGWTDLIVGNDFGKNSYYINQKDGSFIDSSFWLETDKPSYTMGIGIADINRDEVFDFYISNIVVMEKDDKYVLPNEDTNQHFDPESLGSMRVVEANDLFVSGKKNNGQLVYKNSDKIGRGYSSTGWSWDADFFDFDLDGDDDLYCLTGMNQYSIYGKEGEYYQVKDDLKVERVFAQSRGDKNLLFENKNGFLEIKSNSGGLDYLGTSRSAVYADIDNDGDLDIITNEYHGDTRVFRNNSSTSNANWLHIRLQSDGPKSTRDAIGAHIKVTTPDGNMQLKELHSTTGYLSAHPKRLHFGLGNSKSCSIKIVWPNGELEELDLKEVNRIIEIKQGRFRH